MVEAKIVEFINTSKVQGKTKEEVFKELLLQGFSVASIQESYDSVEAPARKAEETHDSDKDTQKRTVSIIVTIGALLIGAGVFSFIASNWQEMGRPFKIFLILLFTVVFYVLGWLAKEKKGLSKTGSAFYLLGSIMYGSGIFLVAQMYNVRANWPDGFVLWMIGSIVAGLLLEESILLVLAIPLGITAVFGHPFAMFDNPFGYEAFLLSSSTLLFIATGVLFYAGIITRRKMPEEIKDYY